MAAELAKNAQPRDPAAEDAAAAIHVRRRRLGPFRTAADTPEQRKRELASLARAGFSHEVARRGAAPVPERSGKPDQPLQGQFCKKGAARGGA